MAPVRASPRSLGSRVQTAMGNSNLEAGQRGSTRCPLAAERHRLFPVAASPRRPTATASPAVARHWALQDLAGPHQPIAAHANRPCSPTAAGAGRRRARRPGLLRKVPVCWAHLARKDVPTLAACWLGRHALPCCAAAPRHRLTNTEMLEEFSISPTPLPPEAGAS